ncbi:MAG: hypothetical protein RIR18_133 [Pseudomonadota bacterium]|jgi:two-component system heavy metal sensor histidine kinase CusS
MNMSHWRNSITLRLSVAFALLATLIFTALGLYLSKAADDHMAELDAHELHSKLAQVSQTGIHEPSISAFATRLNDQFASEHGLIVLVEGRHGIVFNWPHGNPIPSGLTTNHLTHAAPERIDLGEQQFRMVTGTAQSGWGENLRITVASDIAHHTDFLSHLQRDFWLAVLAAACLTVLVGMWISRQGMRRVSDIAHAAGRISAGQLSERISEQEIPTELAELVSAFNAMLGRLEESFQRLSDFSADLAHELRTPIHSLRMQTEVSLSQTRDINEYRDLLSSNLEEYDRLSRIIADMLFLAKADHGLVIPGKGTVQLRPLCQRLCDYYGILANAQSISISGEDIAVLGDNLMLERAIGNLLANAIHHTPEDGNVSIHLESQNGVALITVSNTGPMIPVSVQERIFERFVRLDEHGYEGNGLGLAITKSIVLAHKGSISVQSTEAGTEFCVQLSLTYTSPNTAVSGSASVSIG